MTERLATRLTRMSRGLSLLILLSLTVPLYLLGQARVDNSIEVWLNTGDQAHADYQQFLAKYGTEEFIVVASEDGDPLGDQCLALQKDLGAKLAQVPGVRQVLDLASVIESLSRIRPNAGQALREDPLLRDLLLGRDERSFGLIVGLATVEVPSKRRATVEQIEQIVQDAATEKHPFHMAGTPLMNAALDRGSQRAARTLFPVAVALALMILLKVLRGLSSLTAVFSAVIVTVLWTLAFMLMMGKTFNMVTVILPSLLFVLCLAGGIHVTSRFLAFHALGSTRIEAVQQALQETLVPVCLSSVTTAAGFSVLTLSGMQPVREFGLFAALGMLISMGANLIVIPGVLLLLPVQGRALATGTHWTSQWALRAGRHRGLVLMGSLGFVVLCLGLSSRVRVDANVLKFFPASSRIARDYAFVGERLTGLHSVEVDAWVPADQGKALLTAIDEMSQAMASHEHVAKVIGYAGIEAASKRMSRSFMMNTPTARKSPLKQWQRRFIHRQDNVLSLRLSVLVRGMSDRSLNALTHSIEQQARRILGPVGSYRITGVVPLLVAAQQALIKTQIQSLALALCIGLALIGLFMRSWRALIAAVLPNLLPIAGLFISLVLTDIALDAATVMIASVAIGIGVDDTIHFLSRFRHEKMQGLSTEQAVSNCFATIGRAITFTTLVSVAAFGLLGLAEFKPIQYFGCLSALTLALAWLGDVCVLPVCVAWMRPWDRELKKQRTQNAASGTI
jgi:predicted RND superfamily exporter protein